jgi:hypothetical protein
MTKSDPPPRDSSRDSAQELAMLKRIEADLAIEQLRASKSASERAAEHFGIYGGGYLCFCICLFFGSILFLPESAVSVCASVVTLLITSMIQLLKQVVGETPTKEGAEK